MGLFFSSSLLGVIRPPPLFVYVSTQHLTGNLIGRTHFMHDYRMQARYKKETMRVCFCFVIDYSNSASVIRNDIPHRIESLSGFPVYFSTRHHVSYAERDKGTP